MVEFIGREGHKSWTLRNVIGYRRQNLAYKNKRHSPKTKTKRIPRDKEAERILISHCDLWNDELPKEADSIQYRINVLDQIDEQLRKRV